MNLEEIIKEFDAYAKKNKFFKYYRQQVENFVKMYQLDKVASYNLDKTYLTGDKGRDSYLKIIGSESLMGTRVGQIYSKFPSFFKKPNSIDNFHKFINDLMKLNINSFYSSFRKIIIKKGYFEMLSTLKSIMIQILACYFPEYFLPIYNKEWILEIIKNLKIDLKNFPALLRGKIISNKKADFGERMLISNELLFKKKNSHEIMKHWDNIVFSHFLFMCLPVEAIEALEKLNIGIKYLDPSEQFVVGIFSQVHKRLGYNCITKLKTSYPDAEVEDEKGIIKTIEFEYWSSSFKKSHEAVADLCDIIVCWCDDLDDKWKKNHPNIEIISFEDITDKNSKLYQRLLLN